MNRPFLSIVSAVLIVGLAGFTFLRPADAPLSVSSSPAAPAVADVTSWSVDKAHSEVRFSVRHLAISSVTGFFRDYDAMVDMAPNDLNSLKASATIRTGSIDTGNGKRDEHLRSPDFFDAATFPEMTFESTGISDVNGTTFKLNGTLTIRDVSKPVTLDGELVGTAIGPRGDERAALTATTVINRKEFGLTWDRLTEAGGVIVGEDVTITIDVQVMRPREG